MKSVSIVALTGVVGASAAASAGGLLGFQKVVLRGDPVPGIPDTAFFNASIDRAGITHDGVISFTADVFGDVVGGGNNQGLWSGLPGSLSLVAREGDQAPGTVPGVTFISGGSSGFQPFESLRIANGGIVDYLARLQGPGVDSLNDRGIWRHTPGGGSTLVARESSAAAGLPGLLYDRLDVGNYSAADNGAMLFAATVKGPGVSTSNDFVQYHGIPGSLQALVREGDPAPGTAHTFFNMSGFVLNNNSVTAFRTNLTNNNTSSVFVGTPGALSPIVVEGDAAPGTGGLIFNDGPFNNQSMVDVHINDNNTVAFRSFLENPGDSSIVRSLWRHTESSGLEMVMRQGDQPPGTPAGVGFFISSNGVLNNADNIAFSANLSGDVTGSNNTGIWAGSPGDLRLIARAGDQMPGFSPGQTFDGLFGTNVLFNDLDQVVFTSNQAVFASDPAFGLFKVLAVGDTIEVAPGEFKTVMGSGVSVGQMGGGPSDGRMISLNNSGEILIGVVFEDDSRALIKAQLVPAPGTVLSVSALVAVPFLRRRRGCAGR